ncbi:MAG: hypothetical protein M1834_007770 [Cirrosporium novae-zelandiae]|nr:MAG: hypothetical protein M1834_007770 [Cirrosporium novae-zelandiae]
MSLTSPPPPKNFYIFGQGISFSLSPTIHNTGFQHHHLPHTYTIHETSTVDELESTIRSPSFGGASVTMPHKLGVSKFCNRVTEHGRIVGAINTLIVEEEEGKGEKIIVGDNTDWTGLVRAIEKVLSSSSSPKKFETGLVVGAGGASRAAIYALYKLGVKTIYLTNRTKSRAVAIAEALAPLFPITVLDNLSDVPADQAPDIIVGTIPADKTTVDYFPPVIFSKPGGGVCVEMAYKPRYTPLLQAVTRDHGEGKWAVVTGLDVLLEQAYDQFRLWTGLEAPREVMAEAVARRDREGK